MVAKNVKVFTHSWRPARAGPALDERRLGQLRDRGGARPAAGRQDRRRAEGRVRRIQPGVAHLGDHQALQRLRLLPHQPQRQAHQHGPGALAAEQERDQGRGVRGVLQVPGPRLRRAAAAAALQRRRPALDQRPALRPEGKPREARARPHRAGRRALLPQGADRRPAEGPPAGVAALPQGRRRQRGPARSTSPARRCRTARSWRSWAG